MYTIVILKLIGFFGIISTTHLSPIYNNEQCINYAESIIKMDEKKKDSDRTKVIGYSCYVKSISMGR